MKSLVTLLGLAAFVATASAQTNTFSPDTWFEPPALDPKDKGGMAGGLAVYGALMLFAIAMIILDDVNRHKDANKRIEDA